LINLYEEEELTKVKITFTQNKKKVKITFLKISIFVYSLTNKQVMSQRNN